MVNPQFVNNQIYHLYNRGVEKRNVFLENLDYLRFIHDLFEFNNKESVLPSNIRLSLRQPSVIDANHLKQCLEVRLPNIDICEKNSRRIHELVIELILVLLL